MKETSPLKKFTRREFLAAAAAGGVTAVCGWRLGQELWNSPEAATFVHKVPSYDSDIRGALLTSLRELQIGSEQIKGKRILLKPNLVEPHAQAQHINTHPAVVRAAIEAFLSLGAAQVAVAEAPGHRTDSLLVLEESGLAEVLLEDKIRFHDLNYDSGLIVPNRTMFTKMRNLAFPATLAQFDLLVSVAKMKTHHWAGATLSMKNLFGIMPGVFYGWPKNVFHMCGIPHSICDINAAMPPQLAIVDGIIGMEGDGPIMGTAKQAGVIVVGRSAPAVDATCCRIMGIDPHKISYLSMAESKALGPIAEAAIEQRGEALAQVRTDFQLLDMVPAQRGIRLA